MGLNNLIALCRVPWLLTLIFTTITAQQRCVTPNSDPGYCVPYSECAILKRLTDTYGNNLPANEINYIRNARCNGNTNGIHLCCKLSDVIQPENNAIDSNTLNPRGLEILKATACGETRGNRISNGVEVTLAEFPWMALLRYDSQVPFQCGGSLITNRYVLTAAHCVVSVPERLIGVRLGEHNLNTDKDCTNLGRKQFCTPPVEDYGIEKVIPHRQYSIQKLVNDIAMIKVDRDVQSQIHIKPVCLPITESSKQFSDDQTFFISGWGTTEQQTQSRVLLKAVVPFQDLSTCANTFKRVSFTDSHLCAGGEDGVDTCKGDSGGPLFFLSPYNNNVRFVQYGIVSFGFRVCGGNRTLPGVYSNVIKFLPWITNNID